MISSSRPACSVFFLLLLLSVIPALAQHGDEGWRERFLPPTPYDIDAVVAVGNDLYVGGSFDVIDGVASKNLIRWDGALGRWTPVDSGTPGPV
ncbi:MAG: hypothetical protein ABIR47_05620, partial [Candidatus Kapaibacterium sp.]